MSKNSFGYIAEKIDGGYIIHADDGTTGFLTVVEFEQFKKNRGEYGRHSSPNK